MTEDQRPAAGPTWDKVRLEHNDSGVSLLKLTNPPVNAVTPEVIEEMLNAVDRVSTDRAIRALVLCGTDHRFCAGADLAVMETLDRTNYRRMRRWIDVQDALERLEKPVVCAIERYALGGGAEVSLACDFRVIGRTSQIGFPETDMGLFPGAGGTQRLTRLVGVSRAFAVMAFGRRYRGPEALEVGLADEVVDDADVLDRAVAVATELAGRPTRALGLLKRCIYEGWNMDLSAGIQREEDAVFELLGTSDVREGIRAFHERRPPVFTGS